MNVIGDFEKISLEQWIADRAAHNVSREQATAEYVILKMPERSTSESAGYDFYLPYDICIAPGESILIHTGIKCRIDPGWVLMAFPRSSLGYKFNLHLANTVGIIDADYYNNEKNEGHIVQKLVNNGNKTVTLESRSKFCQGIFLPFGIVEGDTTTGIRQGGIGSTGV